jgi:hypothetical protein
MTASFEGFGLWRPVTAAIPGKGLPLSAKITDRSGGSAAAILAAPAPTATDGLREAFASQVSAYASDLSWRWTRFSRGAARFVRRQTEFNQIARFVLAVPLAVATPSYLGFEARPPAPETAIIALPRGVPPVGAPQAGVPIQPGTVYRVPPSDPHVSSAADAVAGPRIRAICSRAGQTVFMDDRAEVEASADWREEVPLKHPGAVCAFTTRFGVAEPQFRAIETDTVATPVQAAPLPEDRLPIFVKTIPVPSEMLAPPDPRAGGFAVSSDRPDPAKDQIEKALAALVALPQGAGARVAPSVAASAAAPRLELRVASAEPRLVVPHGAVVPTSPGAVTSRVGAITTAEVAGWGRGASPFRHPNDAFRLLKGDIDASIPIGKFGEEENFWHPAGASMAAPFGRPKFTDVGAASLLEDLGRLTGPRRFSWTGPDSLTTYPTAVPAWPVSSVGPRAAIDPKGATEAVDFAATFSAFSEAAPFRVAEGPIRFLIERVGGEARTGWPSRSAPTPRHRIDTAFAWAAPSSAYEGPWIPAAKPSRSAPAVTMLAGL